MNLTLAGAVIALVAWFAGTFVVPVGLGLIHALLAVGVILWIRWWAMDGGRRASNGG